MRPRFLVLQLLAFLVGLLGFLFLFLGKDSFFGAVAGRAPEVDIAALGCGYLATAIGVALGSAYRVIKPDATTTTPLDGFSGTIRAIARSRELWAGLCASPIVFGVLYNTTQGISLPGLIVIALQNGFCCNVVLEQILEKRRADAGKPVDP